MIEKKRKIRMLHTREQQTRFARGWKTKSVQRILARSDGIPMNYTQLTSQTLSPKKRKTTLKKGGRRVNESYKTK
jgi:hypothetical protein